MNKRTIINFVTMAIPLVVMTVALLASPASVKGQNKGQESEIEAVRKKIEALLQQAEVLQDKGATDKAELLVKQAQELKARLAKPKEDRPRKKSGNLGEFVQRLKAEAASLRARKRNDDAQKLERLAAELQKKTALGRADAERQKKTALGREAAEIRKKAALKRFAAEREEKAAASGKRRRGNNEREVALAQLKIMRMALQGLLDAGRKDSAELMEHAIHAQELALEGVRNEKAAQVYKTAPSLGQRIELLMFAAQKLRDAGKKEHASSVARLGEQLRERFRARQKQGSKGEKREGQRQGGNNEREVAAAQVEVMQTALVALREGERKDSADVLNRAIQARLVRLKQLKGTQAKIAVEREPKLDHTVKALSLAANLWREFRNQKNAGAVAALAKKLGGSRDGAKNGDGAKKERPKKNEGLQRVKQLEEEIAELKAALERRLGELKELERKNDR